MKKIFFILMISYTTLSSLSSIAQNGKTIQIGDDKMLNKALDSTITKDVYENSLDNIMILFAFKIDSLGEVHSAHIGRSINFKQDSYYRICSYLENNINLLYLFKRFKDRPEFKGKKYVIALFKYKNT